MRDRELLQPIPLLAILGVVVPNRMECSSVSGLTVRKILEAEVAPRVVP